MKIITWVGKNIIVTDLGLKLKGDNMANVGKVISDGFVKFRNALTGLVGKLGFTFIKEKITDYLIDEIFTVIKVEIAEHMAQFDGMTVAQFRQEKLYPLLDNLKQKIDDKI